MPPPTRPRPKRFDPIFWHEAYCRPSKPRGEHLSFHPTIDGAPTSLLGTIRELDRCPHASQNGAILPSSVPSSPTQHAHPTGSNIVLGCLDKYHLHHHRIHSISSPQIISKTPGETPNGEDGRFAPVLGSAARTNPEPPPNQKRLHPEGGKLIIPRLTLPAHHRGRCSNHGRRHGGSQLKLQPTACVASRPSARSRQHLNVGRGAGRTSRA